MTMYVLFCYSSAGIMCPSYIPNGYINSYCNTMPGQYCHVYYCNRGYKATLSPMTVKCNASGQWEWSKDQGERMCTGKNEQTLK